MIKAAHFFLLTGIMMSQASAITFPWQKSSKPQMETIRQTIIDEFSKLRLLREMKTLSRQMEATYESAKSKGLDPKLRQRLYDGFIEKVEIAEKNLQKIESDWIQEKKEKLEMLQGRREIAQKLQQELERLRESHEQALDTINKLPDGIKLTALLAYQLSVPQEKSYFQVLGNLAQILKYLKNIEAGIIRLEKMTGSSFKEDPRFKKKTQTALKELADSKAALEDVKTNFSRYFSKEVEKESQQSQKVIHQFQEKTRQLNCPAITGIGSGKAGLDKCYQLSLKKIDSAAKQGRIDICRIKKLVDDPSLQKCAEFVGTYYLPFMAKKSSHK
jgi:hypothetical protein